MPLQAQNLWPLTPEKFATAFRYQYVISKTRHDLPGFHNYPGLQWQLAAGKDLPVCELADCDGHHLGYLLGIAVGPKALIQPGANRLPVSRDAADFWTVFENWLTEVAGRYGIWLHAKGQTRF